MGVTLSTHSTLAPISLASTIIGFISFAFTVATAIRVFWNNLSTIASAPDEISDYLSNLKQGLYEERAHLRIVRRRKKRRASKGRGEKGHGGTGIHENEVEGESIANKVLRETIRHMIRTFRELERPFLRDDDPRARRGRNSRTSKEGWDTEGWGGPGEDDEEFDGAGDYYRTQYRRCGLRERFLWLRKKSSVETLSAALARVETRRIAKEVGEIATCIRDFDKDIRNFDDRVWALEQRLSRVIGVRRVD